MNTEGFLTCSINLHLPGNQSFRKRIYFLN
jgi:hypothetical protein